ncbi:hypothetical protein [Pseudoalteromonas byunsanensis]|uniref:Uncharacterized protein n=1 Tax=Pseudoalteromonas byunsanensis TaxID=327939 RepID=A0A1S1N4R4_9GAMM|nr:hypothetical protein [Pseudoalteromonas byunsanensis]OHU94367.1 hypothetical protein BIW53_14910 [Pseudoalteromonas byunsanensis]
MRNILNATNRDFRINVLGFMIVAVVALFVQLTIGDGDVSFYALQTGGPLVYFYISAGVTVTYYSFRYGLIPIIRTAIFGFSGTFILFLVMGVIYAEQSPDRFSVNIFHSLIFIMLFAILGTINGYLGRYISLFNVAVFLVAIVSGSFSEPFIWVSILDLLSINNVYAQWAIVVTSAILGLSKDINIWEFLQHNKET